MGWKRSPLGGNWRALPMMAKLAGSATRVSESKTRQEVQGLVPMLRRGASVVAGTAYYTLAR